MDKNTQQEVCEHLPLIDTGLGYYYCPACNNGWTYTEYEASGGNPPAPEPADIQEAAEGYLTRKIDTNKYYWCKCENCGWEDSSEFLEGCHPIADTGDHSDPVCPVCFCNKIEGEPTIEVPESYSGEVEVKIPLDTVINPYKKTIESLNRVIDELRWSDAKITYPAAREYWIEQLKKEGI